jgi:biopolymer transport protein ExbD
VNDLEVDLPTAASRPKDPKPKIHYITVQSDGKLFLDTKIIELADLQPTIAAMRGEAMNEEDSQNDISVVIRGSGKAKYKSVVDVMDALQQANVTKVNLATEPSPDGTAPGGKAKP